MMKRKRSAKLWIALLVVAMIAAIALSACGKAPETENPPEHSEAQQTNSLSKVGDELCGFRVTQIVHNEMYAVDCIHMEHEKTGAQLVYIPCEDTERSFTVSFRTPAENDKGIPHVYEHSTLGGSEKYPDPSLFFSMIDQTYNTYLNAGTYISNTTFDSASLSEEQLLAFADYTMAGLYHPTIMTDERTMMREAYRYELADEDSPITLTGTVYSEMKAYTRPAELSNVYSMKQLYPGSRFAAFNGGDPDVIPDMTWQELKDFHDKYYHPSNSLTVLYGKLNPEPFLELIDREISGFTRQEIVLTDEGYTPITGNVEEKRMIPVSADSAEETYLYYGIPLASLSDHEWDVLWLYSGMYATTGSPIYNLFASQMPGVSVGCEVLTDGPVPVLRFQVIGATEKQADAVKALLNEGLAQTAQRGVDGDMMKAAATSLKLQMAQVCENNNKGINMAVLITTQWGPEGELTAYADYDRRMTQALELADAQALQDIAEKYLVNPQTSGYGVYVSAPGQLEQKNAAEEARLVQIKEDMTAQEREALIARTQDFAQWTEENAANSMIDAVKVVDAQNLPEEIVRYEAEDSVRDGVRVIRSDVDSDQLVKVKLLFQADYIPYEKYDIFDTYIELLGAFNTENYSLDALDTAQMEVSSGLNIERNYIQAADGSFTPVVTFSWDCLPENIDACYELVRELIWNADTTDLEHTRLAISENNQTTAIYLSMDPSMILDEILPGYMTAAEQFDALSSMGDRFTWYMNRSNWSDAELTAALVEGKAMLLEGMRRENLIVCSVGSKENNDKAIAAGMKFADELSEEAGVHYDYTEYMEDMPESIAFPMDIDVGYNAIVMPYGDSGFASSGKLYVFSGLVQNRLLFPELRFKNACYGAYMNVRRNGVQMFTYRDPGLAQTYQVYDNLADMVRDLELTQEDVDGFIVSVFSSFSMPKGPLTGGEQAVMDKLHSMDTFADCLRFMHEAKQTTPEDIVEMAALIDQMVASGAKISVSNQQLVAENSNLFTVIDDCYMFSGTTAGEEVKDAA